MLSESVILRSRQSSPRNLFDEIPLAMLTLIKFVPQLRSGHSPAPGEPSPILLRSRTCLKVGLVDHDWSPPLKVDPPSVGEVWRVRITRETHVGKNRGSLILHPDSRVQGDGDSHGIPMLLPGFYDEYQPDPATLIVTPKKDPTGNWMLPGLLKKDLAAHMGLVVIVVNLSGMPPDEAYWTIPGINSNPR